MTGAGFRTDTGARGAVYPVAVVGVRARDRRVGCLPTCSSHRPIPARCSAKSSPPACERSRTRWLAAWAARAMNRERRGSATAGVARLLKLLKSAEVVHPPLRARHAQQTALITLIDRLVTSAAALELLPPTLAARGRARAAGSGSPRPARGCGARSSGGAHCRNPRRPAPVPPSRIARYRPMLPVLVELEHVVDPDAAGRSGPRGSRPRSPRPRPRARPLRARRVHEPGVRPLRAQGHAGRHDLLHAAERRRLARHPHLCRSPA